MKNEKTSQCSLREMWLNVVHVAIKKYLDWKMMKWNEMKYNEIKCLEMSSTMKCLEKLDLNKFKYYGDFWDQA